MVSQYYGMEETLSEVMWIWLCTDKHKYLDVTHFVEPLPNSKNGVSGYIGIFAGSKESKLRQWVQVL